MFEKIMKIIENMHIIKIYKIKNNYNQCITIKAFINWKIKIDIVTLSFCLACKMIFTKYVNTWGLCGRK